MELMQEIYDQMANHNLVNNKELLKKILALYKNSSSFFSAESKSNFYELLTAPNEKSNDNTQINKEDEKRFYIKMTNNWISNVLSLSESQLKDLTNQGLGEYTKIQKILKENNQVNSIKEITHLYEKIANELDNSQNIEQQKYFWRTLQENSYINTNDDNIKDFKYVNSIYGKARQVKEEKKEYELHINCANENLFKILNNYIDSCNKTDMYYNFKFHTNNTKQGKLIIYSSKENLKNNIAILKQIAKYYPKIISNCGPNNILAGNIDNWINLISSPEKKESSFDTVRTQILENSAEKIALNYFNENKSRPESEIYNRIVESATNVIIEEMKKNNPNATFKPVYIENVQKFLKGIEINPSKNSTIKSIKKLINNGNDSNTGPLIDYMKQLEELIFQKNKVNSVNKRTVFSLWDPDGKKVDFSIETIDKILKSIIGVMSEKDPNYLKKYQEEIIKSSQEHEIDTNNFSLSNSASKKIQSLDSFQKKIEYFQKMVNYYRNENNLEKANYYEELIDHCKGQTMNNEQMLEYLEKKVQEHLKLNDQDRANYYQNRANNMRSHIIDNLQKAADYYANENNIIKAMYYEQLIDYNKEQVMSDEEKLEYLESRLQQYENLNDKERIDYYQERINNIKLKINSSNNIQTVSQNHEMQQQLANSFKTVQIQKEQKDKNNHTKIDSDLDDFANQERQILSAKRFTDEQKKKLIEELYAEFDNYVEQNPEKGRSR